MAIAKEVRTKIQSIKNTQKITRAMEMVAASKMRKAQERMQRAKPYAQKILQVISHLARSTSEYQHPYLQSRPINKVGYIVVTTDRGLCGGLNINLLKTVVTDIKAWKAKGVEVSLSLVGSKGTAFFKRVGGAVLGHAEHLGDAPEIKDLIGVVKVMLDAYLDNRIDALYLCSNEFVNTMSQKPTIQQVLPIVASTDEKLKHHWDYLYEPDNAKILLDQLLMRYIEAQVYRGIIENLASEQAARMVAMKSATDNAADLIDDLQLVYNKARQSAITQELSEIVAGASVI
ncbi:MAG: F0F1 ATP synthase subunit gamma [Gammaproteobacteria bacterium]|nr:F0F1 ATP synthase subunit gamma [Gammaproteobacteria bacterium]